MMGRLKWIILLGGFALVLLPAGLQAQADLDRVPRDAPAFLSVRVAELWKSDVFKPLREGLARESPDLFEKSLGLPPEEIERLTLVRGEWNWSPRLLLVATTQAYDRAKVLSRVGKVANEEKVAGQTIYAVDGFTGFLFFAERAYAIGWLADLEALAKAGPNKDGPLAVSLKAAAEKHQAVLGVNVAVLAQNVPKEEQNLLLEAFRPVLKADALTVSADLDADGLKAVARLHFNAVADVKAAEQPVKAALEVARAVMPPLIAKLNKEPSVSRALTEVLKNAETALQDARLSLQGTNLELVASVKIDPKTLSQVEADTTQLILLVARRVKSSSNLYKLTLAVHSYHDANGQRFPPAAIPGKTGKAHLSWRVLILPYLGEEKLYNEFHLDEPWDSEHNKTLLAKMPRVFAAPGVPADATETPYQTFAGMIIGGKYGLARIPDGSSYTIMFVEAAKTVPWTKPEDIPFDKNKIVPRMAVFGDVFLVVMCDGQVRSVRKTVSEETLRLAIMPDDGYPLPGDF